MCYSYMATNVICDSKCIDWTRDSKHHDLRFIKKNAVFRRKQHSFFIGKQSNLYCTKLQIKQL
jgi:hypothetical protein